MESTARYVAVGLFSLFVLMVGIIAGLWFHGPGGLGSNRIIEVRFAGPAAGVRTGAPVTFNGVRVGEVRSVFFDSSDPGAVGARLSVSAGAPISADTSVSIATSGLMGAAEVALRGGSADKPLVAASGRVPVLQAEGSASLADQARQTLAGIQGVVDDNAAPLRSMIADIQTFTAALSRNSGKVDGILSGLERMTAGSSDQKDAGTFDLVLPAQARDGAKLEGRAQLVIPEPTTFITLDTQKMVTQRKDGELTQEPSKWSDTTPKLVQRKLLEIIEGAGYPLVSVRSDNLNADLQLLVDIRRFQISAASDKPAAEVELGLRLVADDGKMIASRTVKGSAPASELTGAEAAKALTMAFAAAAREMLPWLAPELANASPKAPDAAGEAPVQ